MGINELSFHDREYCFNLVSLRIHFLIECESESTSIISGDLLTLPVSGRDQGTGVESIKD
jgi:hypothetical protein